MRDLANNSEAFRVRMTYTYANGSTSVFYAGPYGTLGAAKGVRTRELRHKVCASATVERAETVWTEVAE